VLESHGKDVVIVATGSEVTTALKAAAELKDAGILATVVSMPSFRIFGEQPEEYQMSIFPHGVPKVSVEAGATMGWWKFIGRDGVAIGLDRFGASAPGPIAMEKLGISTGHVVEAVKSVIKK
jgi:transketolase